LRNPNAKQNYLTARAQKIVPCHHRVNKNCESPTGSLESPNNSDKKTAQARCEAKQLAPRAQQKRFANKKNKTAKAKQTNLTSPADDFPHRRSF
jgi:hypothetical protein